MFKILDEKKLKIYIAKEENGVYVFGELEEIDNPFYQPKEEGLFTEEFVKYQNENRQTPEEIFAKEFQKNLDKANKKAEKEAEKMFKQQESPLKDEVKPKTASKGKNKTKTTQQSLWEQYNNKYDGVKTDNCLYCGKTVSISLKFCSKVCQESMELGI